MRHFVKFFSPGTFVAEITTKEIDSWDVDKALNMAKQIVERHNARPHSFCFTTTIGGKITNTSNAYCINCVVKTLDQLKAENDPRNKILIINMECNGWDRVVTTNNSYEWTVPFFEGDQIVSLKGKESNA